jgi:hypothetical protein
MTEENNENNIPATQPINTENIEKINKLKNLLQNENSDLFEIISLKDQITFDDHNEEEQINNSIWQKQYISIFPESSQDAPLPIKPNINMINLLLSSASKYKIKDEEKIKIIKNIQEEANNIIKEIKKAKSLEELNNLKNNSDKVKIDLNEYFIQREMKLKNKIGDESEDDSKNAENNKTESTNIKNKEINKSKSHRRKKYKRKEDEYENDFVEDESGAGSEEESERIDLSNHVIDLGKKKSGNNIKRIADELQEEAKNYISMRSRRNINKKKDNDFIYDDIYGKKNDSVNSRDNSNSNINSEDDNNKYRKRNAEIDYDDEDYIEEENKIKERKHKNKAYDDNILNRKTRRTRSSNNPVNESKNTHIDNKKVNNNAHTNIVALNSNEENKIKSRKNALANITKILTDNKYLMEEGMDFVNALANRVEEDLAKAFPAIDFDYQKTLSNMNKTLKEISKYKRINQMVIKGKITLFKMAKFQYGDKFLQKIKKIEEGGTGKKPPKPKPESFSFGDILQDSNNLYSSINDDKKRNNNDNRLSLMRNPSSMSYRSGFSQSSFGDDRNSGNFENENDYYSKTQTGSNSNRYENDDSLESIENQENIRFSPGLNNRGHRDISGNLEEGIGHSYDPFKKDKMNYKNLFPILYDPALDISSKEEELSEHNSSLNDPNIILANPPPTGSTLRIFHGKIRLNHNTLDNASLFSVNKYQNFLKFPSFEKELILTSKAKSNEVIPYCLKQLSNASKLELFGWIEPDLNRNQDMEISKFKELIEEFERNEKCSCLVENKIKLYIFVLGEKDEKLFSKVINESKFVNKKIMQNLNNGNKFLVFVLLSNNDDLENESIKKKKKMHPEIIKRVEQSESDDENENNLNNKKKNSNNTIEVDDEHLKSFSFANNNNNNNEEYNNIKNNENENDNENNNENGNHEQKDEENNDEDDDESCIDKEENEKLKNILEQNDFNAINNYIENNFKDLPLEEMASKLQRFTAENRVKLLEMIKNYSDNFMENENQMEIDEEENNMNNNNIGGDINNMGQINQQMNNNTAMMPQININPAMQMNIYQNDPSLNQLYLNQINIQQQQQNNNINNTNLASMYYNQGMNIYNRYNNNNFK